MSRTTINVSSSEELLTALQSATGGETIQLQAGDYGKLSLYSPKGTEFKYNTEVTITTAQPDAVVSFSEMNLNGVSNLKFDGVVFDYIFAEGDLYFSYPFHIQKSDNITIENSTFDGDVARGISEEADGFGNAKGLNVLDSTNISIKNNEFFEFHRGLTIGRSDGIEVVGNDIHTMRSDGINFAQVTDVLVEGNWIHDFRQAPTSNDHMDMIQFWTSGSSSPNTDIIIRNNLLDVGAGNETQSIFMRNEAVDAGGAGYEMYYRNVLIENNTIYNGHIHGITVGETDGLVIRNNSLIQAQGALDLASGGVSVPAINVKPVSIDVAIQNNITGRVAGFSDQAGWTVGDNVIIQNDSPESEGFYKDVFIASSMQPTNNANNYKLVPGGEADLLGAGSDLVQFDASPASLTPLFNVYSNDGKADVLIFDASHTMGANGALDTQTTKFVWRFEDGTKSEGVLVEHVFKTPGVHDVSLTVTASDGTSASELYSVRVSGEDLLTLNDQGQFVTIGYGASELAEFNVGQYTQIGSERDIKLGGSGTQVTVSKTDIARLFGSDNFSVDFTIASDVGGGNAGELFRAHGNILARVDPDGSLVVNVYPDDGSVLSLKAQGISLLNGLEHDISINLDGNTDILSVSIDGIQLAFTIMTGDLPNYPRDLTFGDPWGGANFKGTLSDFSMGSSRSDYSSYTGDSTKVETDTEEDHTENVGFGADTIVFDIAGFDSTDSALKNDTSVGQTDGGFALSFDGQGDYFDLGLLEQFQGFNSLAIEVKFERGEDDDQQSKIFWSKDKIGIKVVDHQLIARVNTVDEVFKTFTVDNA